MTDEDPRMDPLCSAHVMNDIIVVMNYQSQGTAVGFCYVFAKLHSLHKRETREGGALSTWRSAPPWKFQALD